MPEVDTLSRNIPKIGNVYISEGKPLYPITGWPDGDYVGAVVKDDIVGILQREGDVMMLYKAEVHENVLTNLSKPYVIDYDVETITTFNKNIVVFGDKHALYRANGDGNMTNVADSFKHPFAFMSLKVALANLFMFYDTKQHNPHQDVTWTHECILRDGKIVLRVDYPINGVSVMDDDCDEKSEIVSPSLFFVLSKSVMHVIVLFFDSMIQLTEQMDGEWLNTPIVINKVPFSVSVDGKLHDLRFFIPAKIKTLMALSNFNILGKYYGKRVLEYLEGVEGDTELYDNAFSNDEDTIAMSKWCEEVENKIIDI